MICGDCFLCFLYVYLATYLYKKMLFFLHVSSSRSSLAYAYTYIHTHTHKHASTNIKGLSFLVCLFINGGVILFPLLGYVCVCVCVCIYLSIYNRQRALLLFEQPSLFAFLCVYVQCLNNNIHRCDTLPHESKFGVGHVPHAHLTEGRDGDDLCVCVCVYVCVLERRRACV